MSVYVGVYTSCTYCNLNSAATSQGSADTTKQGNKKYVYPVAISTSVTGVKTNSETGQTEAFSQTDTDTRQANLVQLALAGVKPKKPLVPRDNVTISGLIKQGREKMGNRNSNRR